MKCCFIIEDKVIQVIVFVHVLRHETGIFLTCSCSGSCCTHWILCARNLERLCNTSCTVDRGMVRSRLALRTDFLGLGTKACIMVTLVAVRVSSLSLRCWLI
jgi:hypothetical protein